MQGAVHNMTNSKLIFKHEIPIELSAECNVSLEVLINGKLMWKKNYDGNVKHNEVIAFENEYTDAKKNKLTFLFSGNKEVEKKHFKISQIAINKQILNLYNAEYFPVINQEWWQQLNSDEKAQHQETIYGKTGSEYGWYGEINFYYCAGFDYRSHLRYNQDTTDETKLLGEKINWVYLDQSSNQIHNKIK